MASVVEELKKDLAELENLLSLAQRPKIKNTLSLEIRKLSDNIKLREDQLRTQESANASSKANASSRHCIVKLTNYAWDQTRETVKVYVTLPKVHTLPADSVKCSFEKRSCELYVQNLENKDYSFIIKNLLEPIDVSRSSWKQKTDKVLIILVKCKENNWSHITELDKKASTANKFAADDLDDGEKDPSASLMNMMKKLYETGDDEMKRTIAKAWTESSDKKNELPNF